MRRSTSSGRWPLLVIPFAAAVATADMADAASSRRPELPAIRLQPANAVPACVTPERMMRHLADRNGALDPKYKSIAADYKAMGDALKVRWDWAFYQMLLETNFLKFRRGDGSPGDVKPKQNNFAGIGATGNGVPGESFPTVTAGVKAHLEHLVAYSGDAVPDATAKRTRDVQDAIIKQSRRLGRPVRFDDLTRRWAADSNYAASMKVIAERFLEEQCTQAQQQVAAAMAAVPAQPTKSQPQRPLDRTVAGGGGGTPLPPKGTRAGAVGVAPPAAPVVAQPKVNCHVLTASYGGTAAVLIRAVTAKGVTLTALGVDPREEAAQTKQFISEHAHGGTVVGRFQTRAQAVETGYSRCDGGTP